MAKHNNPDDSIECMKSEICTRKISSPTFLRLQKLDGALVNIFKYKTGVNSKVRIIEELNPKSHVFCITSLLSEGEELEADIIEIYFNQNVNFKVHSNYSHVHGIQGATTSVLTYAKIFMPFRFILERIPISNKS